MLPGMNPRQMQKAMQRMGIKQIEVDASEVIIRCPDKEIVIVNPSVSKVNMMGQETWQISGEAHERGTSTAPSISDDDVKTVSEQAKVSEEESRKALEETKGDIAEAIVKLTEEE